jgi:ligand-binding sensor domain-containing protein
LATDHIWSVYEDSRRRIWVGTDKKGLDLFEPEAEQFIRDFPLAKISNGNQ